MVHGTHYCRSAVLLETVVVSPRGTLLGALAGDDKRATVEKTRLVADRGSEHVDLQ